MEESSNAVPPLAVASAVANTGSASTGSNTPDHDAVPVKPALKRGSNGNSHRKGKPKGGLKWDEAKIEEHDKLRGTRMKIDEPNTPFHHYDSGSETDGSHTGFKEKGLDNNWDHLENKLAGVAAARDAYPSSPSSYGGDEALNDTTTEEQRLKDIKEIEFREHRKRHYNEMELVRKFRQEHPDPLLDPEDDVDNDADDET